MATDTGTKIDIERYYEGRAEVQALVDEGIITQELMDDAMEMIARDNGLLGIVGVAPKQYSHKESLERTITILPADPNMKLSSPPEYPVPEPNTAPVLVSTDIEVLSLNKQEMPKYISLTELSRPYYMENPSYAIQSWLRSENTLAFLDLWERENNPDYDESAYAMFLEKRKSVPFTVTAK